MNNTIAAQQSRDVFRLTRDDPAGNETDEAIVMLTEFDTALENVCHSTSKILTR